MPQRLSQILNVSAEALDAKGVFNAFVDIDSKLYIDPSLLENAKIEEFRQSYSLFRKHFEEVLRLIGSSKRENDVLWRAAYSKLHFKEFKYVALGYSIGGKAGNAIGDKLASMLVQTAHDIVKAGISDPLIFELVGLFEKNIAADRISDMTISIIRKDLIKYTQRVCNELGIPQKQFGKTTLPFNPVTKEAIVFTPKELLQDLPIAYCWNDIDIVSIQNQELRKRVNKIIGNNWKKATKIPKTVLKTTLLKHPEIFRDLIHQYKQKQKRPYDFLRDPSGQVVWATLSEKAVENYPLNLSSHVPVTSQSILVVVKTICEQYAKLIESNGWFEFLYDNQGKLRNERFAQKLFYGIADQYCRANDLNLSREPNAGSGALDFKITKGYSAVVTVEVKYSSNTNLLKGYTTQLATYNKAEGADTSIYLILRTTKSENNIKRIQKLNEIEKSKKKRVPEIVVIDARPMKSASHR